MGKPIQLGTLGPDVGAVVWESQGSIRTMMSNYSALFASPQSQTSCMGNFVSVVLSVSLLHSNHLPFHFGVREVSQTARLFALAPVQSTQPLRELAGKVGRDRTGG
jgi:hypothetical protein